MPLYEYECSRCSARFEELTSHVPETERGKCPKCGSLESKRLISAFRVAGQGDLRENTLHGCHDAHVSGPQEGGHSHDHGHDHGSAHGHSHDHDD